MASTTSHNRGYSPAKKWERKKPYHTCRRPIYSTKINHKSQEPFSSYHYPRISLIALFRKGAFTCRRHPVVHTSNSTTHRHTEAGCDVRRTYGFTFPTKHLQSPSKSNLNLCCFSNCYLLL